MEAHSPGPPDIPKSISLSQRDIDRIMRIGMSKDLNFTATARMLLKEKLDEIEADELEKSTAPASL